MTVSRSDSITWSAICAIQRIALARRAQRAARADPRPSASAGCARCGCAEQRLRRRVQVDDGPPLASGSARLPSRVTAPPPVASTMFRRSVSSAISASSRSRNDVLALDLEDRRDGDAEPALELDVGVEERQVQATRDLAPERRLAGAHEADRKRLPRCRSTGALYVASASKRRKRHAAATRRRTLVVSCRFRRPPTGRPKAAA